MYKKVHLFKKLFIKHGFVDIRCVFLSDYHKKILYRCGCGKYFKFLEFYYEIDFKSIEHNFTIQLWYADIKNLDVFQKLLESENFLINDDIC